jgi:antitoxin ChpS
MVEPRLSEEPAATPDKGKHSRLAIRDENATFVALYRRPVVGVTSKIRKQGGAAVVTIPPALLKLMDLEVGAELRLSVEQGRLVAEPAESARKRYTLTELLRGAAGMKRLTAEVAWAQEGAPVGHEIL